jgi:hypothetical protein
MLKDPRVKVNEPDRYGCTPLWTAVYQGYLGVIKLWIASGREMNLAELGDIDKSNAIKVAEREGYAGLAALLEKFKKNPNETRHAVRVDLGFIDELAAEVFALVVFVSDGLLQINNTTPPSSADRFFKIATQLPLELQMVLCFHVIGSAKEIVPGKEREMAFKELAKRM